jgi:glycine/D-amino acid oxidase-like deaminating enzyme
VATPAVNTDPVWRDESSPALPTLAGDLSAETCVVGLGGSGLACILRLLELGDAVVGIDASQVASGAAGRNGGFLLAGLAAFYHDAVRQHGHDRVHRLYQRTVREIERMAAETPDAVARTGSLRIAYDDEEFEDCHRQLDTMRADHLPVQPYEGPEGQGLLLPTDGMFHPVERCRTLARQALDGGARLFEHSPALEVSARVVRTPGGAIHCRRVVVAVDGRLEAVLPELAGRVRSARLQMLGTAPTDEVALPRPVYTRWGYDYWQQLPDGRVILGGLRDQAGDTEWSGEADPTPEVQAGLELMLRRRVGVRAPVRHRWAGIVGYTADGLPVVDQVRPGVWAIGGYCGTGNVIGALCGRGVAEVVTRGRSPHLAELAPALA